MSSADRSFALVVATAAAPYVVVFSAGCGFGAVMVDRLAADGVWALFGSDLALVTAAFSVLIAGAVAGAVAATRQVRATRRLSRHVAEHAWSRSLHGFEVQVLDDVEPFAMTYGLGRPRVAVSRGLVDRLSEDELVSVLAHERYHARARDPLKLLVARSAVRTCFYLPVLGHLVGRYQTHRELAADRRSVRAVGRPALAGALLKVVAGPGWAHSHAAAAMADDDVLAVRLDQLEHGREPDLPRAPVWMLAVSALSIVGFGVVMVITMRPGFASMATMSMADGSMLGAAGALVGMVGCGAGWIVLPALAFHRSHTRA